MPIAWYKAQISGFSPKSIREGAGSPGERQDIIQKRVRANDARTSQLEHESSAAKPVFALPGCQRMSMNTNSVHSWLLPNSCLLNPGRGPKSNRTSRLFSGSKAPQNSYEPGGLVNSLVSGTPKI